MEIRTANKIRKIGKILFLLYMLAVVYLMFFFEKYDRTLADRQYLFNLVPFREIRRFIVYRDVSGTSVVMRESNRQYYWICAIWLHPAVDIQE